MHGGCGSFLLLYYTINTHLLKEPQMTYVQSNSENEISKVNVQIEKAQSIINLYTTAVIYPGPYPVKTSEVGSGTFISIAGKKGILTNWHVADIFVSRESNRQCRVGGVSNCSGPGIR
jgi:hypothetical protein